MNATAVQCITSRWIPRLESYGQMRRRRAVEPDTLLEAPVRLSIDSADLRLDDKFFTYKKDPNITSVQPKASILR